MILIFSDPNDYSTSVIVEWLYKIGKPFLNVNINDNENFVDIISYFNNRIQIDVNGEIIDLKNIKTLFYRRSGKKLKGIDTLRKIPITSDRDHSILNYLSANYTSRNESLSYFFNNVKSFGNENVGRTNKMINLIHAENSGLKVPKTIFTTKKKDLVNFKEQNKDIIIKSLDIGFYYKNLEKMEWQIGYTNIVSDEDVDKMPSDFPLTLFQKKIEKYFEVRCFYFNKTFFCTAIFSQSNEKTKIDYRDYDDKLPNRQVPFTLPRNIIKKITNFIDLTGINTGSIDFIMDGKDYYFLEVNPVGQFDNVSGYGNWYCEKKIAEYLNK